MRTWALGMVQADLTGPGADRTWTAQALEDGWQSPVVAEAYGALNADRFEGLSGLGARDLEDVALANLVGRSLGEAPDAMRDGGPAASQYGEDSRAHEVAGRIDELMGEGDRLSVLPVSVTGEPFGAMSTALFRIDHAEGGTTFVDASARHYDSASDWTEDNELPPGLVVVPEGLEPGAALAAPEATEAVVDTPWERFVQIGDMAATGLGIAAGAVAVGALIVGTGGGALVVGAGVAGVGSGAWFATRSGAELIDAHQHGEDAFDLTDPETRGRWFDVAAGGLSVASIGATLRAANSVAGAGARTVAGLNGAATALDLAAMGDQTIQLASDWENLSPEQRVGGLLDVAVFAGLGAANAAAPGGTARDALDFGRTTRLIETGTPYRMDASPDLAPGAVRVGYDMEGGRATNVRLEVGEGAAPDAEALRRHTDSARRVEAAGGLLDRLDRMIGPERAPVGSAGWEAREELVKIGRETADVEARLAGDDLPPAERAALEVRRGELDQAREHQDARLSEWDALGAGWIADPARGAQQAEALGWPEEARPGYSWAYGSNDVPYMVKTDPSVDGPDRIYNGAPHARRFESWIADGGSVSVADDWSSVTYTREMEVLGETRDVSVAYGVDGFPDFGPFMTHESGVTSVSIDMTGNSYTDFRRANEAAGWPGAQPPEGWTWHHHEDGQTMQLVPQAINDTFTHRGGASIARNGAP